MFWTLNKCKIILNVENIWKIKMPVRTWRIDVKITGFVACFYLKIWLSDLMEHELASVDYIVLVEMNIDRCYWRLINDAINICMMSMSNKKILIKFGLDTPLLLFTQSINLGKISVPCKGVYLRGVLWCKIIWVVRV